MKQVTTFASFSLAPLLVAALATFAAAPAAAAPVLYKFDGAHTLVSFKIRHLSVTNVTGTLSGVEGTATFDDADPTKGSVELTLDIGTINTGVAKRDGHIKSPDFFDAAKFPKATFKSTKVEKEGSGYKVTGNLTVKDITKPIVLTVDALSAPLKNGAGASVRGTSATAVLVRKDYGLTWNKVIEGVDLVGPDAKLTIDIVLIQAVDQPKQ